MFFQLGFHLHWESLTFQYIQTPPTPAPTQFGEYQLERLGNPPLSRAASSGETQVPSQWNQLPDSLVVGPFTVGPHMLGGMWMLTKGYISAWIKKPWQSTACLCILSKGCSAGKLSGNERFRWVEGSCSLQRPLHKVKRPASLSLLTMMSFSRGHKSLGCQIKCFFWESEKSVDLVLNLFATQMIPNTLLFMKIEGRPNWAIRN